MQIKTRTLSDKEFARLVEQAKREGKEEARLILLIEEVNRQGPSCDIVKSAEIVYGDADKVNLTRECQPYPGICRNRIAIVPLTVPVVVIAWEYDDCGDTEENSAIIYVFTGSEWKSMRIDNLP